MITSMGCLRENASSDSAGAELFTPPAVQIWEMRIGENVAV
jgi:hypothetical protein